jgi:predicted ATP-dependent protease
MDAKQARSKSCELHPEQLRWTCDPALLPFETTAEIKPLTDTIGQDRAVRALEFGLEVTVGAFNVFVAGPSGTGRTSRTLAAVERAASGRPTPSDWCYVFNFDEPGCPLAVDLPAGQARRFAEDMDQLVDHVRRKLAEVFEGREYRQFREEAHRPVQDYRERLTRETGERAQREGFLLAASPAGPLLVPAEGERPLTPEELARLSDAERQELGERGERLMESLREGMHEAHRLEQQAHERLADHNRQVAETAIAPKFDEYLARYHESSRAKQYLNRVRRDMVARVEEIRQEVSREDGDQQARSTRVLLAEIQGERGAGVFDRYEVNVFVDRTGVRGAPVISEPHPTYYNLLGRIEYRARLGSMVTDFRLIRSGALHRANGGYLLINALDLLSAPWSWPALKRVLRTREIMIENLGEEFTPIPAMTLRPAAIPLEAKVVLIGPHWLYYLLYFFDEEFAKLFRVRADFDTDIERTDDHMARLAAFVSQTTRECQLRPFHRSAIARVAEHSARLAEHQNRLTAHFRQIADLVNEASYWAGKEGSEYTLEQHVIRAIDEKRQRSNLLEEKLLRLIDERAILIDVSGERVGLVNALSFVLVGEHAFGRPVRITAQTGIGGEGVVNLERETKLSGPIHSKAFLTLTSFLTGRYAQDHPLALSARITFEQTYDEIEGDSASSSELYALLSSLSGLPVRQGIAVTGSVNQLGEVQAVGGLTAKVEGFFEVCKRCGLTGDQGVVVPRNAIQYLMLRAEVVDAVREGSFHVWAVNTIDEGIELLTGIPAGQRLPSGGWEVDTVNGRVDRRLREYAESLKAFARSMAGPETQERAPAQIRPEGPRLVNIAHRPEL